MHCENSYIVKVLATFSTNSAASPQIAVFCPFLNLFHARRRCSVTIQEMRPLVVPRTRTKYGDRSFAVQGLRVWNSLPVELHALDISQTVFRNKLKNYLFDIT